MDEMDVLRVILSLVGFCALLFLTYVTTRYIGKKQNKAMRSKNISVLETVMLSADKRLHLVKAGSSFVLIATTQKTVEFLTSVNLDEDMEQESVSEYKDNLFDFKSLFDKYTGLYKAKKEKGSNTTDFEPPQDMAEKNSFKSNLSRLRTIVHKDQYQVKENGDDVTNEK